MSGGEEGHRGGRQPGGRGRVVLYRWAMDILSEMLTLGRGLSEVVGAPWGHPGTSIPARIKSLRSDCAWWIGGTVRPVWLQWGDQEEGGEKRRCSRTGSDLFPTLPLLLSLSLFFKRRWKSFHFKKFPIPRSKLIICMRRRSSECLGEKRNTKTKHIMEYLESFGMIVREAHLYIRRWDENREPVIRG